MYAPPVVNTVPSVKVGAVALVLLITIYPPLGTLAAGGVITKFNPVEVTVLVANVGASGVVQATTETELTDANQPAEFVEPSDLNLMVIAPEASLDVIVPGLVAP